MRSRRPRPCRCVRRRKSRKRCRRRARVRRPRRRGRSAARSARRPDGRQATGRRSTRDSSSRGRRPATAARPAPSRSCGRRRAGDCVWRNRRARDPAAPSPRPVALDQRVGRLDQRHRRLDRLGLLEVEGDVACRDEAGSSPFAGSGLPSAALFGRTIATTSAPWSASMRPASGPGPMPSNSITLSPVSGRIMLKSCRHLSGRAA